MIYEFLILFLSIIYMIFPEYCVVGNICTYTISIIVATGLCCFKNKGKLRVNKKILLYILLYIILIGAPILIHGEYMTFFKYIINFTFPIFVCCVSLNTPNKIEKFLDMIILISMIMCVFGIIEYFTSYNIWSCVQNTVMNGMMGPESYWRNGEYRIEQAFGHCTPYSIYLVAVIGIINYKLYNTVKNKIWYFIGYLLCIVNIYMTMSRASMLLVIIMQLIFILRFDSSKTHIRSAMILIIICSVVFVFIVTPVHVLFQNNKYFSFLFSIFDTKSMGSYNTTEYRIALIAAIPKIVKGKQIFGLGLSGIPTSFTMNINGSVESHVSIDNNYLWYYIRYGLFGVIGLLWYYIGGILLANRLKKLRCMINKTILKRTNYIAFLTIITIIYLISQISVAEITEYRIFVVLIGVGMAYVLNHNIE